MSAADDVYRLDFGNGVGQEPGKVESDAPRRSADPMSMRTGQFLGYAEGEFHRIAYTEWGASDAGRVAICVHGLSRQGRDFDRLAQSLAEQGWRVICPDLPGRGQSAWLADPDHYGLVHYATDMAMLIAHLGVGQVDWIGTSLGGLIGILLAGAVGTPVRRLVVNDIGPFLPWSALYRIGTQLSTAPRAYASFTEATQRLRDVHAPFGLLSDAQWEHLARYSFFKGADHRWHPHFDPAIGGAFLSGGIPKTSLWKAWDTITCPTLLLRGEHSDLLQANTAREMTKRGPRATLIEIADCGHAPALMDEFQIKLVKDWLSKRDAS